MNGTRFVTGLLALAMVLAVAMACTSRGPVIMFTQSPGETPTESPTAAPAPSPTAAFAPSPALPTFNTVTSAAFSLEVLSPQNESVVHTSTVEVRGRTVPDAVVTVDGTSVDVDAGGNFSTMVQLAEGPNSIEVIASDFQGHQAEQVVMLIYVR